MSRQPTPAAMAMIIVLSSSSIISSSSLSSSWWISASSTSSSSICCCCSLWLPLPLFCRFLLRHEIISKFSFFFLFFHAHTTIYGEWNKWVGNVFFFLLFFSIVYLRLLVLCRSKREWGEWAHTSVYVSMGVKGGAYMIEERRTLSRSCYACLSGSLATLPHLMWEAQQYLHGRRLCQSR